MNIKGVHQYDYVVLDPVIKDWYCVFGVIIILRFILCQHTDTHTCIIQVQVYYCTYRIDITQHNGHITSQLRQRNVRQKTLVKTGNL